MAGAAIRAYREAAVSDEIVESLLAAAMAAPSAVAKDPWRFVVVRDRERPAEIAAALPMLNALPVILLDPGSQLDGH